MDIRIAGTEYSLNNFSYEIYMQGCDRHCEGCHNPQTWDFRGGKLVDVDDFLKDTAKRLRPFIISGMVENIYITGGDLLCCKTLKSELFSAAVCNLFWMLNVWLFTGEEERDLPQWVFQYYDVIKAGKFDITKLNPKGTFPASSNQVLLFNEHKRRYDKNGYLSYEQWYCKKERLNRLFETV